jgi:hypothetical protein
MFSETIALFCENRKKHTDSVGRMQRFSKAGGTYENHRTL